MIQRMIATLVLAATLTSGCAHRGASSEETSETAASGGGANSKELHRLLKAIGVKPKNVNGLTRLTAYNLSCKEIPVDEESNDSRCDYETSLPGSNPKAKTPEEPVSFAGPDSGKLRDLLKKFPVARISKGHSTRFVECIENQGLVDCVITVQVDPK